MILMWLSECMTKGEEKRHTGFALDKERNDLHYVDTSDAEELLSSVSPVTE